jgi:predicted phage terminase large subunit-like protein
MSVMKSAWRLLRQRGKARKSFREFCEITVFKRLPWRVAAPHHDVVCSAIQALSDDPDGGILIILMPPGGGKSMIAAKALPAWAMGRQPGTEVVMITNAMPLAERNGRAVRDIMQTTGYQRIFGTTVSASLSAASSFSATNGSEFFGVGSAGAVLGRRGKWIIIDDPVSGYEEANSMTQMAKLHNAFEAEILTRLVPGAKVVLIQQRLSRNDLSGYLIDRASRVEGGRKTTVIRMPMLCDDPENDPLGRAEGEPLWPAYYTPGMLVDAQADDFKWKTLYMQSPPSDEGVWADSQDVQVTTMPHGVVGNDDWRIYIGVDLAYSVNKGDFTVFAVVAFHKATGAMHLVDLWRKQTDPANSAEALLDLAVTWKPAWIGIDDDNASKVAVTHIRTRAAARGVGLGNLEMMPIRGQDKETRAGALRAKIKSGMLHVDRSQPWAHAVMRELLIFPNAMSAGMDDIVDSLSVIARKTSMMMVSKPEAKVVREEKVMGVNVSLDDLWDCQPKCGNRI